MSARVELWRRRRAITDAVRSLKSDRFARAGVSQSELAGLIDSTAGKKAMLATVAFNAPNLIDAQATQLRRHFRDDYVLLIADNSSDMARRREIHAVATSQGASYIPLPPNPFPAPSDSHGAALNWISRRVFRFSRSTYLGLLDHDIFPYAHVSYEQIVRDQGSYGHFQTAADGRYRFYWPGLMFFTNSFFRGRPNYLPRTLGIHYGDTGAGNWHHTYSGMALDQVRCMQLRDVWADRPDRDFVANDAPGHKIEAEFTTFDDSWVHLINGSNWAGISTVETKRASLQRFLADNERP